MTRRPRVAFVVQRCGEDIAGGAESLCLQLAQQMSNDWDVEILTTCARDTRTWADEYVPGPTTIGGVTARRFSVPIGRDVGTFDRLSKRIANGASTRSDQEAWMRAQGPVAPDLLTYLARHGSNYDRIFFFSYLYATTALGLPLVAERAILVPLAHDEWMLDVGLFRMIFGRASAFAFVSHEERALVEERFPEVHDVACLTFAVGIDPPSVDGDAFRVEHAITGDLFVYVGRVEPAKGTDELLASFAALQTADPRSRTLVLVGPVDMPIPRRDDVVALGRVDEQTKWNALAAATIVCVPSTYESLSLVALEAWSVSSPILANGGSAVVVGQCRRANAGLWYATEAEFVELARTRLFGRARELGASGQRYVHEHYTWPAARRALRSLVAPVVSAA